MEHRFLTVGLHFDFLDTFSEVENFHVQTVQGPSYFSGTVRNFFDFISLHKK